MTPTTALRDDRFAARMLDLAAELFDDYDHLPIMAIVSALNEARRDLAGPDGEPPAPELLAAVARERLAASEDGSYVHA